MVCDRRFRLARVYRRTPAALEVLADVHAAIDTIDTGDTPWPDQRLTVLRTAHSRTTGYPLPVRWRQLLRAAARCSDLPASGELVAPGALPHVWPYLRAAEHDLPWPLAVVLDEYFTERECIGIGTGRIVFTDGPDRVLKVPFTTVGVTANQIEAAAAADSSSTVVPIAPCQLVLSVATWWLSHSVADGVLWWSSVRVRQCYLSCSERWLEGGQSLLSCSSQWFQSSPSGWLSPRAVRWRARS